MNDTLPTDPMAPLPTTAEPDEMVVYTPHLELVRNWLAHRGITVVGDPDSDPRLDLTLVKLASGGAPVGEVEPLLGELRTRFAADFGGWTPLVGKNRHLANVVGMPQPKPHTNGDPQPAGKPPTNPAHDAGRGVRVGVLDTKLFDHPDLAGSFLADKGALLRPTGGPVPMRAGHATFIAGLVLGQAPAAELRVADVLDNDGRGTMWDTAKKLMALADSGLDVLNLSLGARTADNLAPLLMERAVRLLSSRMVIVASAGNHGELDTPVWPAALPDVIAVGARDAHGEVEQYSPKLPWVGVTAPGTAVSTYLETEVRLTDRTGAFQGYASWQGTSFAAAAVSGAIAAKTVPGKVGAREALQALLAEPDGVLRRYVQPS